MAKLTSFLLFLFLVLSAFSHAAAAVFRSLDCGTEAFNFDDDDIPWVPDDLYITGGETRRVPGSRRTASYAMDVTKGERVLVRASFYYGNYDGKSSLPTFDLQFDGNHWENVATSMDSTVYNEVIYVPKRDEISVCVAQTSSGSVPFVSALEVLPGALILGCAVKSIRIMGCSCMEPERSVRSNLSPATAVSNGIKTLTTDSLFFSPNVSNKPPSSLLRSAITASKPSDSITLFPDLPTATVPAYASMYFSEMSELDSTQKRSFVVIDDLRASEKTSIALVPTPDSTLPPIISAVKVYAIRPLTNGTDSRDMEMLHLLQKTFYKTISEWNGDPCLPANFTWDWVACTSDEVPRVTALYLSDLNLYGSLPDFGGLEALETIDMHNNSLNGGIPDFLGSLPNLKPLPNLKQVNLAGNDFSGPIPSSITKNTQIRLNVSGKPDFCASDNSCETSSRSPGYVSGDYIPTYYWKTYSTTTVTTQSSKVARILGGSLLAFYAVWVVSGIIVIIHQRRKAALAAKYPEKFMVSSKITQSGGFTGERTEHRV
ncbi:hypothetical protein H6P81_006711 [Aristolochia fimbriata]|uniref:Malectin-like domain-containing protein n=1 Tax=Aristolochia fimbriata TaxID=158543 RepID=A0AAV7F1I8_ARIFI|nr:hypothetical protein H6P81_006711 [Aristolochia fimbriata]